MLTTHLQDFVDSQWITELARTAKAELSPVCAILGGMIGPLKLNMRFHGSVLALVIWNSTGQEVVKAVSAKDEPINNFFFWDGQVDTHHSEMYFFTCTCVCHLDSGRLGLV